MQYDYMDNNARNTSTAIHPDFIEVQTPEGWVPISDYDVNQPLVEMRDKNDNDREMVSWGEGVKIVLTLDEINNAFDSSYFTKLHSLYTSDPIGTVQSLEERRDHPVGKSTKAGLNMTFTFRGATMQTSGHPKNWEYAFSVENQPGWSDNVQPPKWLAEAGTKYQTKYQQLASKQISDFHKNK